MRLLFTSCMFCGVRTASPEGVCPGCRDPRPEAKRTEMIQRQIQRSRRLTDR